MHYQALRLFATDYMPSTVISSFPRRLNSFYFTSTGHPNTNDANFFTRVFRPPFPSSPGRPHMHPVVHVVFDDYLPPTDPHSSTYDASLLPSPSISSSTLLVPNQTSRLALKICFLLPAEKTGGSGLSFSLSSYGAYEVSL
ncbi:hypothetical protein E1B28_013790 [Marasmius oreades]|uniref:Uncharacterized protein n=1 Tax=Marasmius oreades TaxID=181124 RepID=A0A9P7RQI9_9AGAR|nr:uncharacterized protein E1B28_013790 [Marasmius oreades]KAG7087852.1 hypothetical protein E1B28_013790 [Marasmius oreades]